MNTRLKNEKDEKWLKPRKQLMYVTIVVQSFLVGKGNARLVKRGIPITEVRLISTAKSKNDRFSGYAGETQAKSNAL